MEIHVVDTAAGTLVAKEKQKYCKVEHTGQGAATLRGDMCFIKVRSNNQFAIQPALKKECLNQAYLDQMGIEAQDIFANLNVMVVSDDSGFSTDVQHIGSRPVHINIAPLNKLLKISEDYGNGVPQFTTDYNIDADWGPVSIKSSTDETEINLSFLVSNITDKKCLGSSCSSTSNFTQPFFGQIELFKLRKNASPELVDEWWDGGLVPPNWQGFVKGMRYRVPDEIIQPGRRYRMIATFQNPTDDYAIFLGGLQQMLIRQFSTEGATVGIDSIPALGVLRQLGIFPELRGVSTLNSNNQLVDLSQALTGLEGMIKTPIWPPYYSAICDDSEKCLKLGNRRYHQRLILEFAATSDPAEPGAIKLENLRMQKDSPLYRSYPMQEAAFPQFMCER